MPRKAGPIDDVGGIGTWNETVAAVRANPDTRALTGHREAYAEWLPVPEDGHRYELIDGTLIVTPAPPRGTSGRPSGC